MVSGVTSSRMIARVEAYSGIPPRLVVMRAHPAAKDSRIARGAGSCQSEGTMAMAASACFCCTASKGRKPKDFACSPRGDKISAT